MLYCQKRIGCGYIFATKPEVTLENEDAEKLELYRLIGEGYKAIQDGRTRTIEEVREKLEKGRETRGQGGIYGIGRVRFVKYSANLVILLHSLLEIIPNIIAYSPWRGTINTTTL